MNRDSVRITPRDDVSNTASEITMAYESSITTEIDRSFRLETDGGKKRQSFQTQPLRPLTALAPIFVVSAVVLMASSQWASNSCLQFKDKGGLLDAMKSELMQASSIVGLTLLLPFFINWLLDLMQGVCSFIFGCDGTLYVGSENAELLPFHAFEMSSKILGILILAMPSIMAPPMYIIKRTASTLHPSTGCFTRLLGFAPDYWALHPTSGLCIRLLGFAFDY